MTAILVNYSPGLSLLSATRKQVVDKSPDDMDAKEQADRMAAAEALGALSSVAVVNRSGNPLPYTNETFNRSGNSKSVENGKTKRKSKRRVTEQESAKSRSQVKPPRAATSDTAKRATQKESRSASPKTGTSGDRSRRGRKTRAKNSTSNDNIGPVSGSKTPSEITKVPVIEVPSLSTLDSGQILKVPSHPNIPSLPSIPSLILQNVTPNLTSLHTLGSLTFLNDIEAGPRTFAKSISDSLKVDDCSSAETASKTDKFLPFKKRRLVTGDNGRDSSPTPHSSTNGRDALHDSRVEKKDSPSTTSESHVASESRSASFAEHLPPGTRQQLLREISAVLSPDEDGDLPLHLAVVHEHQPLVEKFIKLMRIARRPVDRFNKDKQTPLHLAVKLDFAAAVRALLAAGADVNLVDKTGCTSLHLAVKHQLGAGLRRLCELSSTVKPDLNARNFDGLTPLHTAVENRDVAMVRLLLDNDANIDVPDGKSGRTPLFHAVENNRLDLADLFLQRGANPDLPNYAGITAVMSSQARNLTEMSKLLSNALDNGDSRSNSPLPVQDAQSEADCVVTEPALKTSRTWKHPIPLRNPATVRKQEEQDAPKDLSITARTKRESVKPTLDKPRHFENQDLTKKASVTQENSQGNRDSQIANNMEWRASARDTGPSLQSGVRDGTFNSGKLQTSTLAAGYTSTPNLESKGQGHDDMEIDEHDERTTVTVQPLPRFEPRSQTDEDLQLDSSPGFVPRPSHKVQHDVQCQTGMTSESDPEPGLIIIESEDEVTVEPSGERTHSISAASANNITSGNNVCIGHGTTSVGHETSNVGHATTNVGHVMTSVGHVTTSVGSVAVLGPQVLTAGTPDTASQSAVMMVGDVSDAHCTADRLPGVSTSSTSNKHFIDLPSSATASKTTAAVTSTVAPNTMVRVTPTGVRCPQDGTDVSSTVSESLTSAAGSPSSAGSGPGPSAVASDTAERVSNNAEAPPGSAVMAPGKSGVAVSPAAPHPGGAGIASQTAPPSPGTTAGPTPGSSPLKLPFPIHMGNIHQILQMIQIHDPIGFQMLMQGRKAQSTPHSSNTESSKPGSVSIETNDPSKPRGLAPTEPRQSSKHNLVLKESTEHSKPIVFPSRDPSLLPNQSQQFQIHEQFQPQHSQLFLQKAIIPVCDVSGSGSSPVAVSTQVVNQSASVSSVASEMHQHVGEESCSRPVVMETNAGSNEKQPYITVANPKQDTDTNVRGSIEKGHIIVASQQQSPTEGNAGQATEKNDFIGVKVRHSRQQGFNEGNNDASQDASCVFYSAVVPEDVSSLIPQDLRVARRPETQQDVTKQMLRQKVLKLLPAKGLHSDVTKSSGANQIPDIRRIITDSPPSFTGQSPGEVASVNLTQRQAVDEEKPAGEMQVDRDEPSPLAAMSSLDKDVMLEMYRESQSPSPGRRVTSLDSRCQSPSNQSSLPGNQTSSQNSQCLKQGQSPTPKLKSKASTDYPCLKQQLSTLNYIPHSPLSRQPSPLGQQPSPLANQPPYNQQLSPSCQPSPLTNQSSPLSQESSPLNQQPSPSQQPSPLSQQPASLSQRSSPFSQRPSPLSRQPSPVSRQSSPSP